MRLMENGPERQAIIDRMVAILRDDAPVVIRFSSQGLQPAPRLDRQLETEPDGA
jgi:hypothetical protein